MPSKSYGKEEEKELDDRQIKFMDKLENIYEEIEKDN